MDFGCSAPSPTADPIAVIELAQTLVARFPSSGTTVTVLVLAYLEALASLLDDYEMLGAQR